MITDHTLIKCFLNKDNFIKYRQFVNEEVLSAAAKTLLFDLSVYYAEYENIDTIDLSQFITWFNHIRHSDYKDNRLLEFKLFFEELAITSEEQVQPIIQHYKLTNVYYNIELLCLERATLSKITNILDEYKASLEQIVDTPYSSNAAKDLFNEVSSPDTGLKWPLDSLNRSLGYLRKGHLGIVAAYVHAGKTAFLCHVAQHMAAQLPEDQCVLYFNNEGTNREIQYRLYQSVLNAPLQTILNYKDKAERLYSQRLGGVDKIKVIECSLMNLERIQVLAKEFNAGLVIIDQLANLLGGDVKDGNEALRLKKMGRIASSLAIVQCPVLMSHQCDNTVSWIDRKTGKMKTQRYIKMNQLDGSKIHLPGTANYIITIGMDYEYPNIRFIHVPKNRMPSLSGMNESDRFLKTEVKVDWDRMRYSDL